MKAITKTVLEFALEEEMSGHVGYDKHAVQSRKGGDCWNGTRSTLGFPPGPLGDEPAEVVTVQQCGRSPQSSTVRTGTLALFRWRATKVTPCAASGSTSRPSPVDELYVPTTPDSICS